MARNKKYFKPETKTNDSDRHHLLSRKNKESDWIPIYEIGEMISKKDAQKYYEAFINEDKARLTNANGKSIKSILFGKAGFLQLLFQPDCHGVRVYPGRDKKGNFKLMFVGVYKDGTNMTRHTLVFNGGYDCPDMCANNENGPGRFE